MIHAVQLVRYRVWYFAPLALGCFSETIAYISRSLSSKKDPYNIIYFVVQYFFIVVAPVFISASIYVCINRLITWAKSSGYLADRWYLKPRAILWGFITADVLSTIMQIAGAASVGAAESKQKDPSTGNNVLLAGLAIQSFSFTIFLVLLAIFRLTLAKGPSAHSKAGSKDQFILALALASLLIYLRTIFRLAETAEGVFSFASTHEALFGSLEFAPVVLAVWILAIWHPGRWVPTGAGVEFRESSAADIAASSDKERPSSDV